MLRHWEAAGLERVQRDKHIPDEDPDASQAGVVAEDLGLWMEPEHRVSGGKGRGQERGRVKSGVTECP